MGPNLTGCPVLACRVCCSGTPYPSDWIKKDPLVPVLGFLG